MTDLPDAPELRPIFGNGWQALAAAVCELAVHDLQASRRLLRESARAFLEDPEFAVWLELAGVAVSVGELRDVLRRRGLLPAKDSKIVCKG
jgi:hypothetical protein